MSADETLPEDTVSETEPVASIPPESTPDSESTPETTSETPVASEPQAEEAAPTDSTPPASAPVETTAVVTEAVEAPVEPAPVVEATATAEPVVESPVATDDTPAAKPRVRLNPTIDEASAKPVASVKTDSTAPENLAPTAEVAEESEKPAPVVLAAPPVEIPRDSQSLDAEMEAEIEAALSSGEREVSKVVALPESTGDDNEAPMEAEPITEESLESGMRLTGKIQSIHGDDVFLDIGLRYPAIVQSRQFAAGKKPEVGLIIEISVDQVNEEEGLILVNLPHGVRKVAGDWDSISVGQTTDCVVTKSNKGGLEVTVGGLRGFMPAGQVDLAFVADLEVYVGQQLRVQVIEVKPKKRNLVVSHRAHLLEERKGAEEEQWKTIAVGQNYPGKVKTLKNYGAFIDIGGLDGFLHISEISWNRIKHPSEVLQVGQEVEVQVSNVDREKKRVGLGMRQLVTNPWTAVTMNYPAESTVSGKVTRIADFGAFVELEPGVEGLVHISEIDHSRVRRVADMLKVNQEIQAKVVSADPDKRRISLSIKALKAKPEGKKSSKDQGLPEVELYKRKRKGPLKGGMGTSSGSLFGNPSDFK